MSCTVAIPSTPVFSPSRRQLSCKAASALPESVSSPAPAPAAGSPLHPFALRAQAEASPSPQSASAAAASVPAGSMLKRRCPTPLVLRAQCLLHLANLYAAIPSPPDAAAAAALPDRLVLCYVHPVPSSSSPELKIAYRPGEKFSLRDFHHAVNNSPLDGFIPERNGSVPTGAIEPSILGPLMTSPRK